MPNNDALSKFVNYPNSNEKVPVHIDRHNQAGTPTGNELIATWMWPYDQTDGFECGWDYMITSVWIEGSSSATTKNKYSLYSYPEEAINVRFWIRPISKTHTVNKKEVNYWTVSKTITTFDPRKGQVIKLDTPSAPSLEMNGYQLTISVDYSNTNASHIMFVIIDDTTHTVYETINASLMYGLASAKVTVSPDKIYRAYCKAIAYTLSSYVDSDQSEYGSAVESPPNRTTIAKLEATSTSSVKIYFTTYNATADSYEVEYAEDVNYFGHSDLVNSKSISVQKGVSYILINGLESAKHWYIRVRAVNNSGSATWSNIADIILGSIPNAPTIWSSSYVAIVGDPITLYWTHNSTDGSKEVKAKLTFQVVANNKNNNGSMMTRYEIDVPAKIENNEDVNTFSYVFYPEMFSGIEPADVVSLVWSCKTQGIIENYSPESIKNTINFYPKPSLILGFGKTNKWYWDLLDLTNGNIYTTAGEIDEYYEEDPFTLIKFPLYIEAQVEPLSNNRPVECFFSIYAENEYQTLNHVGETIWVTKGTEVFSRTLTAMSDESRNLYTTFITARDVVLENNQRYRFFARAITENGLVAETERYFDVNFENVNFRLNAELGYDEENVSVYIQPYCINDNDEIVENTYLSVYRKNFDGTFVTIADDIDNTMNTTVIDPHPTLKNVQYRLAAYSLLSGSLIFNDLAGYPIPETAIIIQWEEAWSSFNIEEPQQFSEPVQSLSLLKLPYNIDTSESNTLDSKTVEYIGRKHPVAYYGTQVGQKISLKCDIEAEDTETLYHLRRLAVWPGNVYIREPSGNGYYAMVSVSFSTTHCNVVIPVSIEVTRVEGDV